MPQTNAAESSPAEVTDPFQGRTDVTLAEWMEYRSNPEKHQQPAAATEEPAASQESEQSSEGEQPESAGESEAPEEHQEQPKPKKLTAEGRIAQLNATIEKLWAADEPDTIKIAQLEATKDKIEHRAGFKRKTEAAPVAQPQAQPAQAPPTRPKPTIEDKNADGTPKYAGEGAYEAWFEDLADWKAEQRIVQVQREYAQQAQLREFQAKMEAAIERYPDFAAVADPFAGEIATNKQIPDFVKDMLRSSDLFPDLVYTIADDAEERAKFMRMAQANPTQAARYIAALESGIREELATAGKEATPAPEPKQTKAPKPVAPVGGGSSRAFDVNDESLSASEWARKRNEQLARRKG